MSINKNIDLSFPPEKLPHHIAIIMDGNGRWAEKRGSPRFKGHKAGVETVRSVVQLCGELDIEALTLFAFSSENWRRPKKEVGLLFELFLTALNREVNKLHKNNVRVKVIGELSAFPEKLQKRIKESMDLTQDNTGLCLNIAANYGGRWDIVESTKKIAAAVACNELSVDDITEETIELYSCMSDLPEPDLFIRTGGEQRISNFLIWQLAYTELYFTATLWPDFNREELAKALQSFVIRQRRFGMTGAQIVEQQEEEIDNA